MFFALPFIIFFTVSSGYSFRPRTTIRMLLKSGYDAAELRPLDIVIKKDTVDLVGKIFRYEMKPFIQKDTTAVVDLYSMVHIGDSNYYKEIQRLCCSYDVVLYELITSEDLVSYEGGDLSRKKLISKVFASRADSLAQQFNLSTQLSLDLQSDNWYIADLSKEVIDRLEKDRLALTNSRFLASQIGGRAFSERITLRNFFLSDAAFVTTLRLLSWLLPCPELAVLLLDWARMQPRPGGLPPVLVPIFENLFAGDVKEAQKLAFAQQLLSGLPDAGGWGGAARADVGVRVRARNQECSRVLRALLDSGPGSGAAVGQGSDSGSGPMKVAVLYGAYHVADLHSRFLGLGLRPSFGIREPDQSRPVVPAGLVAWSMKRPQSRLWTSFMGPGPGSSRALVAAELALASSSESTPAAGAEVWVQGASADPGHDGATQALRVLAVTLLPLYLLLGALDWSVAQTLLAHALSVVLSSSSSSSSSAVSWEGSVVAGLGSETGSLLALGLLYVVSYVQRHTSLLSTLSAVGVQWDRPLFDLPPTHTLDVQGLGREAGLRGTGRSGISVTVQELR